MDSSNTAIPARSEGTLETLAFLLTDIEGSTSRWDAYPEPMRIALTRHDALLRNAIGQAGGTIFKATGDGVNAVFSSPKEAVQAALQAQRGLGEEDFSAVGGLAVRMAIDAGLVETRDADYFGPPLNRAARLLATAAGGQVLISSTAAELVRAWLPETISLQNLGRRQLKGIAEPGDVFELRGTFSKPARRGRLVPSLAAIVTLGLAGAGVTWWETRPPPALPLPQQQAALVQAVGGIPCALLAIQGNQLAGVIDAGTPDLALTAALKTLPAGVQPNVSVSVINGHYCPVLDSLASYHPLISSPAAATLTLAGGNAPLHQSDIIKPRFTMPNFTGYVQADYFSSGTVYHFWPLGPAKPSQASQTLTFNNGIGQVWPPFDTDLIVVIVTPTPLFSTPRPQNEPASTYLADLNDALQNNAAFGNQASISALPVVTEP